MASLFNIRKLNFLFMHVFGIGYVFNTRKFVIVYNVTLALFLCSLGFALYLEKSFFTPGKRLSLEVLTPFCSFSIFATCLQFVQYYLVQTHVFYTILQTTFKQRDYLGLLSEIDRVCKKFGFKAFAAEEKLALVLLAFYSVVCVAALSFPEQFVSSSCWISLYLSTMTSAFYVNHLIGLLRFCANALACLNKSLEDLDQSSTTLSRITTCFSLTQVDSSILRDVLILHKVVCDLAKRILEVATVSIALLILTWCFGYAVLLYKIAMYFISSIQVRQSQWSTVYMIDCQTIVLFAVICALVKSSESVMHNAHKTAVVLHRVKNIYPNFGGEAFNTHSMKMLNQKLRLTLSGVFNLDYSLLFGILVTFGTLVVISLQCDEDFLVTNPKTLLMFKAFNKSF